MASSAAEGERPTAAALAAALAAVAGASSTSVPAQELDHDPIDPPTQSFGPAPVRPHVRAPRARRRLIALVGVAVLAGGITATALYLREPVRSAAGAPVTAPTAADSTSTSTSVFVPSGSTTGATEAAAPCPTDYAAAAEGGIPSRCAVDITVTGLSATIGQLTWEVGVPGDVVAVSDLSCDGSLDVALLRPATGELFIFRTWARPGIPATATALPEPVHASTIAAGPGGCGLVASRPDGSGLEFDAGAFA